MPLPFWFENAVVLTAGLLVGSFLNVVIYRLPRELSVVRPRSRCLSCQRTLSWHHNVPVLSYLWLRGKCSFCRSKISVRYPVVELLTALLFVAVKLRFSSGLGDWALWLRDLPFVSILVAVTFIDLEHRIIPDELSVGGLVLGLMTVPLHPELGWMQALMGAAIGFGIFFFFAWLYERMTQRIGLGGGDVKLLAMIGAFVGIEGVFTTILISSVVGSVVGLVYGYLQSQKQLLRTSVPYGPFLVLGALYAYLFGGWVWLPLVNPS